MTDETKQEIEAVLMLLKKYIGKKWRKHSTCRK